MFFGSTVVCFFGIGVLVFVLFLFLHGRLLSLVMMSCGRSALILGVGVYERTQYEGLVGGLLLRLLGRSFLAFVHRLLRIV